MLTNYFIRFALAAAVGAAPAAVAPHGVLRDVVDQVVAQQALPSSPGEQDEAAPDQVQGVPNVEVEEVELVVRPDAEPEVAPEASARVLVEPERAEVVGTEDLVVADTVTAEDRVVSPVIETDGFQTLGVTWAPDETAVPAGIQVRTLGEEGWSEWHELEIDDTAPDPGTADAMNVRAGTEALWVGQSEALQLSFDTDSDDAQDLRVALVSSPEVDLPQEPAVTDGGMAVAQTLWTGEAAVATVSGPPVRVITRAEWGAAPQSCRPDVASRLVGATVHHTAGSNGYATVAQAMQQIRNDQRYHMVGRGWCDLGYNFVVDKWGNLYEGRAESLTRPVIGVHAGGFNTSTVGVTMLGTYNSVPSAATQRTVGAIIGWRLGAYAVNPQSSMTYRTGEGQNSKFRNQDVHLPRIFGHRDVAYTACPGNGGYAALGNIRAVAEEFSQPERLRQSRAVVRAMYHDILLRDVDSAGLVTWSGMLASGAGQPALVASLTSSEEYVRMRITDAYVEVLGRKPDAAGMKHWYDRIRSGTASVDDVKRRFYDSQEYYNRSGGTAEGYVTLLYETMFERRASVREAAYWSGKIDEMGRSRVVDAIWFSYEAALWRSGNYYRAYLDREPDAKGQADWARTLLRDGEGAVRIGIAGSEEYRQLALKNYG